MDPLAPFRTNFNAIPSRGPSTPPPTSDPIPPIPPSPTLPTSDDFGDDFDFEPGCNFGSGSDSDPDTDITLTSTDSTATALTKLPTYPDPLRRPIFICRHTLGPLPINYTLLSQPQPFSFTSSSSSTTTKTPPAPTPTPTPTPPLVFLHPCRACHFSFTDTLATDIYKRFSADLDETGAKIKQVDAMLAQAYTPDVARIRHSLVKLQDKSMERRREEIKEAWDGFKAVWGNWGSGNEGIGNEGIGRGRGRARARGRGKGKDGVWRNF